MALPTNLQGKRSQFSAGFMKSIAAINSDLTGNRGDDMGRLGDFPPGGIGGRRWSM